MSTTKIHINDLYKHPEAMSFKLCYVDTVPQTYYDYTPESKKLMETEEYKEYARKKHEYLEKLLKEHHHYSSSDMDRYDRENDPDRKFETEMMEYPHPDFEAGYTHYLYFTSDIENQQGDDWDDAPYEYNAGTPYDDKTDIVMIPVTLPAYSFDYPDEFREKIYDRFPNMDNIDIKFPCDYGYNSPFCVININMGAVAWIFGTDGQRGVAIHGGDTLIAVIPKIDKLCDMAINK